MKNLIPYLDIIIIYLTGGKIRSTLRLTLGSRTKAMIDRLEIGSFSPAPNGYDSRFFVEGKVSAVAKNHPQGVLFDTNRLWQVPAKVEIGGTVINVDILDRIPFKESPYHWSVATFLRGYQGLGMGIDGLTGTEAVTFYDIYSSPNSPGGISVRRETEGERVRQRLWGLGVTVYPLSSNAPEIAAYYSTANPNRLHFYPGGTRNDYAAVNEQARSARQRILKAA